jgi:DNA-binding MarR family transcriptional regulator
MMTYGGRIETAGAPMNLSYPVSTELLTLNFATYKTLESELRRQHDLSILQYRAMSLMQQGRIVDESRLIERLDANASQLSQNLSSLAKRDYASWEPNKGSTRSWMLTRPGMVVLDDADVTVIQVYERYFTKLDSATEQNVLPTLRMTSQTQGTARLKDGNYFDEQSYFESILSIVHATIKSLQSFDLSPVQFRIMFELLQHGPAVKAHLAAKLVLARSTVNWACETLAERGLVRTAGDVSAKSRPVVLTQAGRAETQRAAQGVDQAWCDVRVWTSAEKLGSQKVAEYFVETFAH